MSLITPDSLVFDIGANVGQSALQFVLRGAKQVVSVEPCLENLIAITRVPRTIAVHAACWFKPDIIPVYYSINSPGWSSVLKNKWQAVYQDAYYTPEQFVPAITLDMLAVTFGIPDVVKIDVEGAELPVLEGMNFKPRVLFFEFHHKTRDEAVEGLKLCKKRGYTKAHYVRDNLDLDTEPTTKLDDFIPRFIDDNPEWGNFTLI